MMRFVLGALVMLLVLNLAGFGPALVSYESVRVILPPQRQAAPVHQVVPRSAMIHKPRAAVPAASRPVQAPSVQTPLAPTALAPAMAEVDVNVNVNIRQSPLPPAQVVPQSSTATPTSPMVVQASSKPEEVVIYNKLEPAQFLQLDEAMTPVQVKMVACTAHQGCSWRWVTVYHPSLAVASSAKLVIICDDNLGCSPKWVTIFPRFP